MRGDGYLPGALVLAYALKQQSKQTYPGGAGDAQHQAARPASEACVRDCICLVTDDVTEKARLALGLVYDKVIPINELRIKSDIGTGRSDRNLLMTRLEALRLGPNGGLGQHYDKIILLDADVLPLSNYDELFALPAPAGIIMEGKDDSYSNASKISDKWSWHSHYEPVCPHGIPIPKEITDRVAHNHSNMGVNAGLWVLEPSKQQYDDFVAALHTKEIMRLVKNFPWPEMQLATLLWSGQWTNIDIRYCSIGGYPRIDVLCGIHFAGLKPWQIKSRSAMHYAKYPDFTLWRQYFTALYWSTPALQEYPMLKRLYSFCNLLWDMK